MTDLRCNVLLSVQKQSSAAGSSTVKLSDTPVSRVLERLARRGNHQSESMVFVKMYIGCSFQTRDAKACRPATLTNIIERYSIQTEASWWVISWG